MDMPDPTASRRGVQNATLDREFIEDFTIEPQSPLFTIVTPVALALVFFSLVLASIANLWVPFVVVAPVLVGIALFGFLDHIKAKKNAAETSKLLIKHYRDTVIKPAFLSTGIKPYKSDEYFLKTLAKTGRGGFRAYAPDETSGAWCRLYNAEISGKTIIFSYELVSAYDGERPGTTDDMIRHARINAG